MIDLPQEVLLIIFLHLNLDQKMRCMLVCRDWYNLIRAHCLLDVVDIVGGSGFGHFLELLHAEPDRGAQVKHMIVMNNFENAFPTWTLCNYFPNLISMCLRQVRFENYEFRSEPQPHAGDFGSLRNHIEQVTDYGHCDFTMQLLSSGVCIRLTTLTLDLETEIIATSSVFDFLENAPNLLSLTVFNPNLTVLMLDRIHTQLPKLEKLVLNSGEFMDREDTQLPTEIVPWASVTTLSLAMDVIPEAKSLLLGYIQRKFVNVETFSFWEPFNEVWDKNEIKDFTTRGLIPFIQSYGVDRQLNSLKIQSLVEEVNVFTVMDDLDYQLQSLGVADVCETSIFRMITASRQFNYIVELVLNNIEALSTDYELLGQFPSLHKLELTYIDTDDKRETININHLLDSCANRLRTLLLGNVNLTCNGNNDDLQEQYRLEKITLKDLNIPDDLSLFLSNCCQNLSHFTFSNRTPFTTTLNIPNIHLSYFNQECPTSKNILDLLVTTSTDGNLHRYSVCFNDYNKDVQDALTEACRIASWNTVSSTPLGLKLIGPPFELKCASVRNIFINNLLAC